MVLVNKMVTSPGEDSVVMVMVVMVMVVTLNLMETLWREENITR